MPREASFPSRLQRSLLFGEAGIMPALFALLVLALVATQPSFLSPNNLVNVLRNASFLVIAASGQMLVLIVGGFDLSIGAAIALASVVSAGTMAALPAYGVSGTWPVSLLGIGAGLLSGAAVGLANAVAVAMLHVPPFMATLATMSIANGLGLLLTNGIPIYGMPAGFVAAVGRAIPFGLPIALYAAVVVVVLLWVMLNRTRLGRYLCASGGNLQAAKVSGINTRAMVMAAYVMSGVLASITGVLLTAEIGSGQATTGEALMLESLAASVLGGVSLRGGVGRVELVAVGAIFLLTLTNAMDLMHLDTRLQLIALGCVLALAVSVEVLGRQRQAVRV